jgi:hypothetical protein
MGKWSDLTEKQKEKRRATHREGYERHRAERLEYQRNYRLNMTEKQKEREKQRHRDMYAKYKYDRENAYPLNRDPRIDAELLALGITSSKKHGENVKDT